MNRLLTSVLCSLVGITTVLQADASRPRLVVGIVVDQLRTDYIEYLRELFGERGFNLLMNKGAYLRNVDFPTVHPDAVSATALLYTGNYPATNGVASAYVYDQQRNKLTPTLREGDSFSPAALLLSTVSDEVAIDSRGIGSVYSVATDPQQAVIMAGHAGNGAAWISDTDGRWEVSPFYGKHTANSPAALRNVRNAPAQRIDTMQWRPALPPARYPGMADRKDGYAFKYTFSRSDREGFRKFLASPLANREVTDVAIDYLRDMHLGTHGGTDMLNIAYTAAPYKYATDGDARVELQDTYVRLDADLGRLFDAIDKAVGLDNTLIYLSSTGYYDETARDDGRYRIPSGNFSVKRAVSLLNSYLSASYGNGTYVAGYSDGHFYLNRKALEGKDYARIVGDARDFLVRMSGITDALTVDDILSGGDATAALRRSLDVNHCGDIYVAFTPGWTVTDDTVYPARVHNVRLASVATPFFLMAPSVAPMTIGEPVEATVLAPTVTQTLRIRAPNGALSRPLLLDAPQKR